LRVAIFLFLLISFTGVSQTYSEFIDRANQALENKDNNKAADIYDSAFARSKANSFDLYNAACANSLAGRTTRATRLLRSAFENGYDDFAWMYYDKDLNPIREHPAYRDFEKQFHPDSIVYLFDILEMLHDSDRVDICNKTVNLSEGLLSGYTADDIMTRAGGHSPADTVLDLSGKRLRFCESLFENPGGAYNMLSHLSLGTLIVSDCSGNLKLLDIEAKDIMFYEISGKENNLRNVMFDGVTVNGAMNLGANGFQFFCKNSTFNTTPDEGDLVALVWNLDYERMEISNSTFDTKRLTTTDPFEINIINSKRLRIQNSKFNYPMRFRGDITDDLNISGNTFPPQVDLIGLQLPDFNCYFPFSQLHNSKLIRIDYDENDNALIHGDSTADYADNVLFDELTGLYKRLYDSYRSRADISSANNVYVRMKEIEITHLKSMDERTPEETLRLRLNQLMGFYTDHATSPGKALIISCYIILVFGIFYYFFPSDWDTSSKSQLVDDFKRFIEKNEHGYVRPFFKMMQGLIFSLLNAVALSMNAFITLGFGNIPTTGIARYMCIIQGMLGWFLLSLFTVALLNQVLL
jgi:hypothetical protein